MISNNLQPKSFNILFLRFKTCVHRNICKKLRILCEKVRCESGKMTALVCNVKALLLHFKPRAFTVEQMQGVFAVQPQE